MQSLCKSVVVNFPKHANLQNMGKFIHNQKVNILGVVYILGWYILFGVGIKLCRV